ncbi:MAG: hypothetical protein HY289_16220 [Planctomycetes bacterium]|nr:hypothetical protein [Planctomycetota bacterium]
MRPEPRRACWNLISLATPFVGFFAGGAGGNGVIWDGHPMEGIFCGVLTWGICCGLGLVAAIVATIRAERWWGVTAAAIVLNGILPVILLCAGCSELMTWGRYG